MRPFRFLTRDVAGTCRCGSARPANARHISRDASRRGAVAVYVAIMAVPLLGFAALAVDLGYLHMLRRELQNTADACALAGAAKLPSENAVREVALPYAAKNMPTGPHGTVLVNSDIVIGNWDVDNKTFVSKDADDSLPINAVHVTTRRDQQNGNPATLFFAQIFGKSEQDVHTVAVAMRAAVGGVDDFGGGKSRFLIDDEMFDTDKQAIEELADDLNVDKEDLLTDNDGDWFIDIPPGTKLWLPTGQMEDEALFEILDEFPFSTTSEPSHADFLNYNEDSSSWRYDLVPKEMLDPLLGLAPFNDAALYPSLVDPDFIHVSPIFKSDISELDSVNGPNGDIPAVNALGWRRGLLAFKIIDWSWHPAGFEAKVPSYLPYLRIEVVDPVDVNLVGVGPPYEYTPTPTTKARLVW